MLREQKLLAILLSYTPNEEIRQLCLDAYRQMVIDRLSVEDIEAQLINCLHDGVVKGNWFGRAAV